MHPHHHLDELALGELERRDRLAELHALLGVVERRLVAGPAGAGGAPQDAVAGLVEARQRAAHGGHLGQAGRVGQAHVVEHELAR